MRCPDCNTVNSQGATFCEYCGADLSPTGSSKRKTVAEIAAVPPATSGGASKRRTVIEDLGNSGSAEAAPRNAVTPPPLTAQTPDSSNPFARAVPGATPVPSRSTSKSRTVFETDTESTPQASTSPAPEESHDGRRVIGVAITFDLTPGGAVFPLREGKNTIGREADRDIVLDDQRVSGIHACIQHRSGRTWLYDENSNNGTYLNGDDIFQERPSLSDNDTVKVGTINLKLKLLE